MLKTDFDSLCFWIDDIYASVLLRYKLKKKKKKREKIIFIQLHFQFGLTSFLYLIHSG